MAAVVDVRATPIRGVIFDLGGTLIPPMPLADEKIAHLLQWAAGRGLPAGPEAAEVVAAARRWLWDETFGSGHQRTTTELIARAAQQLGWPTDPAFLEEASRAFHAPEVARRAYPDAGATLAALRDLGLRLAVISVISDHWLLEYLLEVTGLRSFVDPIVSSAGYGRIKPDPGIFRIVLDRWAFPAEACVMVGDTLDADIGGSQVLGMRAILVTMDPNPWNEKINTPIHPDATAASLTEVADIIQGWMRH
ncbi:MAG: HAD family hydrolase [Armatimonadetes bacterium]|nr:HAD family hydrolase [Armatimonadota bacterium]